ncbi:MAG: hypothetical protein WD534_09665 [Phycisphaeraceae bacterium]
MPDSSAASPDPTPSPAADAQGQRHGGDRRRSVLDTRSAAYTGLERRRGPGRRRNDFVKAADEGEMSPEQFLFLKAIDAYKRVNNRPYPTWTEVLEVIRKLGYRKTQPMDLTLTTAEDWTETADAPAFQATPDTNDEA